ncbi:MAG: alternative oxidase [Rhizobiales bacterium]|nr:alternative oxidase [Hyphomicrobiales bacterium]
MLNINKVDHVRHHVPTTFSDRVADLSVRAMLSVADRLFGRRYGDRVIVLETIAAVPAMVAATFLHLRCLRRMIDDRGWVRAFMDEADNQRFHLMAFVAIVQPSSSERLLIAIAQSLFYNANFLLYLVSARTAHRLAGYLAERSIAGYSELLTRIEAGEQTDWPAPLAARDYWNLRSGATLSDMIKAMREDEAIHRDIHHAFADARMAGKVLPEPPGAPA